MRPEAPEKQAGQCCCQGGRKYGNGDWPFVGKVAEESVARYRGGYVQSAERWRTGQVCSLDPPFMIAIRPVPPGRVIFMSFANAI